MSRNANNPKPLWPFPPSPRQVPTTTATTTQQQPRTRPKATPKPPKVRRPNNTTNDGLF